MGFTYNLRGVNLEPNRGHVKGGRNVREVVLEPVTKESIVP